MKLKLFALSLLLIPSVVFTASADLIDAAKKESQVAVYSISSRSRMQQRTRRKIQYLRKCI